MRNNLPARGRPAEGVGEISDMSSGGTILNMRVNLWLRQDKCTILDNKFKGAHFEYGNYLQSK